MENKDLVQELINYLEPVRTELRKGLVIEAYDRIGKIVEYLVKIKRSKVKS